MRSLLASIEVRDQQRSSLPTVFNRKIVAMRKVKKCPGIKNCLPYHSNSRILIKPSTVTCIIYSNHLLVGFGSSSRVSDFEYNKFTSNVVQRNK